MTVRELIARLKRLDPKAVVITNECEATHLHEEQVELTVVAQMIGGKVYIGT